MKPFLRALVRKRAKRRCEYCRLHEDDLPAWPFHVEHLIPKKHGGTDDPKSLAWPCHYCNLCKSSNLSGRNSKTGRIVTLFNPRRRRWSRPFSWCGPELIGPTPCGRATIAVLNINAAHRVALQKLLIEANVFPPD
ncbi:MAG: HNH endonuclease [Planctomycetes bacterium]|nr:HNH endonuclease [Planctomycetota bacterium]